MLGLLGRGWVAGALRAVLSSLCLGESCTDQEFVIGLSSPARNRTSSSS